ncbi:hypothetical protein DXA21_21395 [Parabacteroides distasonis]|nr:hypothetical protein DXA21_21395 [Parabacteroides distasonis]
MDHTYYSQSSRGEIFGGGIRRRRRRKKRRFLKLFIILMLIVIMNCSIQPKTTPQEKKIFKIIHYFNADCNNELQHTEQVVLVSS